MTNFPTWLPLLLAAGAGAALGVLYSASLWFTIQRLSQASCPTLWLIGNATLRLSILMAAFFLMMDGQWLRLIACLVGFWIARTIIIQWLRQKLQADMVHA